MEDGLFVIIILFMAAVAALFLLCKKLQMNEARKFNSTGAEEFGDADFSSHGNLAAAGVGAGTGGGYVLLQSRPQAHRQENGRNSNGTAGKDKSGGKGGMDPRDPDAWKRQDSENSEGHYFAQRKDDPWKSDPPKTNPTASTTVVVVGASGHPDQGKPAEGQDTSGDKSGRQVEGGPETAPKPEPEFDIDADGEILTAADDLLAPLIQGDKLTPALEPTVTVVPMGSSLNVIEPIPAPPPPAFSTAGFWEAQEAAKSGGGSGSDFQGGYGGDGGGSSNGWGNNNSSSGGQADGGSSGGWGNDGGISGLGDSESYFANY